MVFKVCTIVRDHLFASILPLTQRYDLTSLVNLDKNICSGFLKQWFFHSLIDPPPSMEDCHNCPLFSSAFLNCRFLLLTHTCRPGHHLENTFVSTISTLTLSRIILAIAYFTYPPLTPPLPPIKIRCFSSKIWSSIENPVVSLLHLFVSEERRNCVLVHSWK